MSNAAPDILNDQTLEFGRARPRLNASLRFYPRTIAGRTGWLVEDELTGRYYRIGMPQYVFLTLLNGQRTVSSALMHSATLLREDALDESEAAALCQWAHGCWIPNTAILSSDESINNRRSSHDN